MPMSTAGLIVFSVVLAAAESDRENTMIRPTVMLVRYAPTRYPPISRTGRSSSNITVVAATSVGFSEAVSESRMTSDMGDRGDHRRRAASGAHPNRVMTAGAGAVA